MQNIALIGVGNIGKEYQLTRHNIGFLIIDAIATSLGVNFSTNFNASFASVKVFGCNLFLLKPSTYVNKSGTSVSQLQSFYKLSTEDIIVFSDDVDMDFIKIKHKINSGHGGHNGLRDIITYIGNGFNRIKIGVGKPISGDTASHVLSKFTSSELHELEHLFNLIVHNLELLVNKDFTTFVYNLKVNLDKEK